MADYNLKIIDNKVIFDGHAENSSDCHTLTLLCNLLQKNTKTIDYRAGYAEFEFEDVPSENRFFLHDAQTFYINDILVQVDALQPTINAFLGGTLSIGLSFSQDGVTVHNTGSLVCQIILTSDLDLDSYFSVTSVSSISAGETALLPFLDNIKLRSILSSDGQEISEGNVISDDGTKLTVSKIKSVDLTTLPGWSSLSTGSHNITVVAKADGYKNSEPSAGVTVTKEAEEYTDCITFTGETSDFTLKATNKEWDGTVEYSTDHNTWTVWGGMEISSSNQKLYLRGSGNTTFFTEITKGVRFVLSARAGCSGNVNTLLEHSAPPTTLPTRSCYRMLFYGCTNLTTAPALPATTLAANCYYQMFSDCTSLTTAPALPATTLAEGCYMSMFTNCTSLTTAPALPATTLATSCCNYMFQGCTSFKVSKTQTVTYQHAWRIPSSGTISSTVSGFSYYMLSNTGGTFTSDPSINTTYYVENEPV